MNFFAASAEPNYVKYIFTIVCAFLNPANTLLRDNQGHCSGKRSMKTQKSYNTSARVLATTASDCNTMERRRTPKTRDSLASIIDLAQNFINSLNHQILNSERKYLATPPTHTRLTNARTAINNVWSISFLSLLIKAPLEYSNWIRLGHLMFKSYAKHHRNEFQ